MRNQINNTRNVLSPQLCMIAPVIFIIIASLCMITLSPSIQAAQNNTVQEHRPLRIAVAANFTPTLEQLAPLFTQETGIKVQLISSSSGNLYQQIKHGAPFDVFMSADKERPQRLVKEKLALPNKTASYAFGTLSFWSASWQQQQAKLIPTASEILANLKDDNNANKFAIANPKIAPYGKAAKEFLKHNHLWENIKPRLIIGININQTFQQLYSQAVPLGIVATSQLTVNNLNGVLLPSKAYQAIEQQITVLARSQQFANAERFFDFILGDESQGIIQRHGYDSAKSLSQDAKQTVQEIN